MRACLLSSKKEFSGGRSTFPDRSSTLMSNAPRPFCFFFQAEDAIRDADVTGVQTCALPISAVIVADPTATPLTRPLPLTVATAVLLLAHVTVRPVSGAPLASFGVAVSCTACPTWTLAGAGLTVTDATGRLNTVIAPLPLFPS